MPSFAVFGTRYQVPGTDVHMYAQHFNAQTDITGSMNGRLPAGLCGAQPNSRFAPAIIVAFTSEDVGYTE